jgi:hypothetical protein
MKEVFGVEMSYVLNSRIVWKHFLIALFAVYFITSPILSTFSEYYNCLDSISEIEEERMKHVNKLKR